MLAGIQKSHFSVVIYNLLIRKKMARVGLGVAGWGGKHSCTSLVALTVKSLVFLLALPVTQETQVRCLGQEDPLEKRMATRSSILAWRIPWTEEPGRLQSMGPKSWTRLSR